MSYGHADEVARGAARTPEQAGASDIAAGDGDAAGSERETSAGDRAETAAPPLAPKWYARPEFRQVFTEHDIGALFRALGELGVSQREIARLTGRSQANVSEIVHGRQVISYAVLVAIADGLGVPRERMGLSWWGPDGVCYGPKDAYPGGGTVVTALKGVSPEMWRRHLIAMGGVSLVGVPIEGIGELLATLAGPDPEPKSLPDQLDYVHLTKLRDLTQRLKDAGRTYGFTPEVDSAAAETAMGLLKLSGPESLEQAVLIGVAELHIVAGASAFDAGRYERAMYHYAHAMELAIRGKDVYCQVLALNYAGLATVEHGYPDDGLKMLQIGEVRARDVPLDLQRPVVVGEGSRASLEAYALADSATALAALGRLDAAFTAQAKSREVRTPASTNPAGDVNYPAACLEFQRGRLETAEALAAASVRRWSGGVNELGRTDSSILQATIHVAAGEPRGLQLAHSAITSAMKLSSFRTRQRLNPLVTALQTRRGSDYQQLARMARQVAATRL